MSDATTALEAVIDARVELREAVTSLAAAEYGGTEAEAQYAADQLALAARNLVRATDALSAAEQPEGWGETP